MWISSVPNLSRSLEFQGRANMFMFLIMPFLCYLLVVGSFYENKGSRNAKIA